MEPGELCILGYHSHKNSVTFSIPT